MNEPPAAHRGPALGAGAQASGRRGLHFERSAYDDVASVVEDMRRLAERHRRNPKLRRLAIQATRGANSKDADSVARAIDRWIRERVRYVRDPYEVEWLQDPLATLRAGTGDCDDMATLAAALLESLGVPARFKRISQNPARPDTYTHVFAEYQTQAGEWKMIDPTLPRGAQLAAPVNSKVLPLNQDFDAMATQQVAALQGPFITGIGAGPTYGSRAGIGNDPLDPLGLQDDVIDDPVQAGSGFWDDFTIKDLLDTGTDVLSIFYGDDNGGAAHVAKPSGWDDMTDAQKRAYRERMRQRLQQQRQQEAGFSWGAMLLLAGSVSVAGYGIAQAMSDDNTEDEQ